jgi:hypothetical protein
MITPSEKPRDTSSMTSWFVIRDCSFWEPPREETSKDAQRRQRNPRPIQNSGKPREAPLRYTIED